MASSKATTVEAYLEELPEDRRAVVSEVRDVLLRNLPEGYQELMNWGMITYELPLERYPNTYNKQPLLYAGLAAQKNNYSLYLTNVYSDPVLKRMLEEGAREAGKKLDMGKSCIRFRRVTDLPLDVIGEIVASTPPDDFITLYEEARQRNKPAGKAGK